ncbi:MAG TPA: histidine kinase dimerization/phospho-acceptor domain-containing protein [Bacteriovoracaceae bacterium]|nr:histidine kinase dimerization/phospho-acceptor domain-containing protein [Bacteriovoracaceae bacterium]
MLEYSNLIEFRLDPKFDSGLLASLNSILQHFSDSKILKSDDSWSKDLFGIDIISESSAFEPSTSSAHLRICLLEPNQGLFSFTQNLEEAKVDFILDENLNLQDFLLFVSPKFREWFQDKQSHLQKILQKNLKKFESAVKQNTGRFIDSKNSFSVENLLSYAQDLVELEKELIHTDISKFEKILKQFIKTHLDKTKLSLFFFKNLNRLKLSQNILPLPAYKGEFIALDLSWDDSDTERLVKQFFFYATLVGFFNSQIESEDPFFDQKLWEESLDAIPFPVVLMGEEGEIHQHNGLFSKLNFAPVDCLKLTLREKIIINDIPYNIFRKDIQHLDDKRSLFVFFTESFFIGDEGPLTPTGQELGIISSSIAHELNNPIAGIQAALSFLLLDEELEEEARGVLKEMKNGSTRCKQLVETFLGFSRARPQSVQSLDTSHSMVELCFEQAQNLLRFRTVESGIRFSLEFSEHARFRPSVNLSLMTMTFYLIMGELMTLYSHQMLVANRHQIEKVIRGEVIESAQEIQIQLHELNISSLTLSKLIQNLLNIENFVLQVSDYSLRFIHNP